MFGVGRIFDKLMRPVQRPLGRRFSIGIPEFGCRIHSMDRLAGAAGQGVQRSRQVGGTERLCRGRTDQVALGADLVGPAVERTKTARPRAGHSQTKPGQHWDFVQGDLGAFAARARRDLITHPC